MPLQAGLSRGANCSELVLKTFERNPHGNRAFSLHRTLVQRLRCAAHPRVSAWLHVTIRPPQIPNATPWRRVAPSDHPGEGDRSHCGHSLVAATGCDRKVWPQHTSTYFTFTKLWPQQTVAAAFVVTAVDQI